MERVITYIDGFNLYFGLKQKYGRKYIWLDIEQLSKSLLKNNQALSRVKYFTSRIGDNPDKVHRQETYLDALSTLPLVNTYYGQYLINNHKCPTCGSIEHIPSEKMTDVNIATHMLVDAFTNLFDIAILISGDSDLSGPIIKIKRLFPDKKIVVAFPPERSSFMLKKVSSAYFSIGRVKFEQSQFPENLITPKGFKITKPMTWK